MNPETQNSPDFHVESMMTYINRIMEELLHLTEMREEDNFDNPFVLSFLSNYIVPNSYIPDRYLFKWEMDRIPFSLTGKTA